MVSKQSTYLFGLWYRHITAIMWPYNALKLKKIYSFTVFSTFWWLFSVLRCAAVFSHTPLTYYK